MEHNGSGGKWFTERTVVGVGDDGAREVMTIWIERRAGALWAVGRAVGLAERRDGAIHRDDYVFEGYEMGDALEAANEALAAELEVAREEGRTQDVAEFAPDDLLRPLERWFFGHEPRPSAGTR
ncbi:MAG: hypothetical protein ACTHNU_17030 [Gaiellales bacterium]